MFKLNLKIALRNLWKQKGYTLINLTGLAIGMASCILLFIFIRYQLSFDKGFKKENRIYRMVTNWKYNSFDDYSQGVPIPLSAAAKNEFAGFEKVAPIVRESGIIVVKDQQGKELVKADRRVFYTVPDFFAIFDLIWLSGSPKQLSEPNTVTLSESTAKTFFGNSQKALGKNILYRNNLNLKVIGVFKDMPENSSFPLEIVISHETFYARNNKDWGSVSSGIQCYVLLREGIKLADLQLPLKRFNDKYYKRKDISGNQNNTLQSLRDIHFNSRYGSYADSSITKKEIYGLAIIGLFLIITACINFINLATAQAINRSKEVGVRKVMGSRRKQLIICFLTETLMITVISLMVACILAELAIPEMQNLFSVKASFGLFNHPEIFLFMAELVVFVSFFAGFYPAIVMSGFNPALAIKNKAAVNSGGLNLRKVLVIVQFGITTMLIISTLVIIRQMQYVREQPLGFNPDAVLMINAPMDSLSIAKRNTFKERILNIPGVQKLSFCVRAALSGDMNTTNFSMDGKENKDFEVRLTPADENYFGVFDLKIIAGKIFAKSDTLNGYVVNETFLKRVFISDPEKALGKIINQNGEIAPITGVVKDFNDQSLKEKISPMIIFPQSMRYYSAAIKLDKTHINRATREIELLWNATFPEYIYYSKFVNDDIERYYHSEQITGKLFRIFAGVILFISFIGLFGLISFVATQRTREVAIRKVLGASTYQLVQMLNSSFLIIVFIANLLAWPLAYLFASKWLSGFAYRIDLSIWPFILSMLTSMLITLVTVTLRSYKAAKTNPVDALKYE